jgi:hypothetical protein
MRDRILDLIMSQSSGDEAVRLTDYRQASSFSLVFGRG